MKAIILTALGIMFNTNAWASGGFGCEINQKGLKLQVSGVTSRSFGSSIVDTTATLKGVIRDGKKKIPLVVAFTKANVSQYWNMGPEFRIAYNVEQEGSVYSATMLIIETKGKIDSEFVKGTATISHYPANAERITRSYDITCMVE